MSGYPIMPTMPISMAKGLKKTPNFGGTIRQKTAAGITSAVSLKPYPTWDFEFSLDNIIGQESNADSIVAEFVGTYMATSGGAGLFLFTDPQDSYVTDAVFGTGNAVNNTFQLSRPINGQTDVIQNVNGSIQVFVNGVLNVDNSISSTGVVTFGVAPSDGAVLSWTGSFYFLCRFSEDTLDAVRSFTINSGTDQWNFQGIKFSSEFVTTTTYGSIAAAGGTGSGGGTGGGGVGGGGVILIPIYSNPLGGQSISTYPLTVASLDSASSHVAESGFISLSNTDTIVWRNAANSADLALGVNGSNQLTFNGSAVGSAITVSGTPSSGQVAVWTSSSELEGVSTTGSGDIVLASSPTLVTPNLGTPSTLVLTNATGAPTWNQNTTGTAAGLTGTPSITVNALSATTINGAALSGTFTGNPTFSGTPEFSAEIKDSTGSVGTSTYVLSSQGSGSGVKWVAASAGGSSAFSAITGSTNDSAAMVVAAGATLTVESATFFDEGNLVFNVLAAAYGAKGDGATDDTAAIQAAIAAAYAAGGGVVYIPPTASGYKISAPLKLYTGTTPTITSYSNIRLVGGGSRGSGTLINQVTTNTDIIAGLNDAANGAQSLNCSIEDMCLQFTGTAFNSGNGIYLKAQAASSPAFSGFYIKNVLVQQCQGAGKYGFNFEGLIASTLINCESLQDFGGFLWNGAANGTQYSSVSTSNSIISCYSNGCLAYGYTHIDTTYTGHFGCACDFSSETPIFTQLATDSFNRSTENPLSDGGNWVVPSAGNGMILSSANEVNGASGSVCMTYYNGSISWGTEQYSEVTIGAGLVSTNFVGPAVFCQTGVRSGYVAFIGGGGGIQIQKQVSASGTVLATGSATYTAGDVIRLSVTTGGVLNAYHNGTLVCTATDTTYTSGFPGIASYQDFTTAGFYGPWNGGNVSLTASYAYSVQGCNGVGFYNCGYELDGTHTLGNGWLITEDASTDESQGIQITGCFSNNSNDTIDVYVTGNSQGVTVTGFCNANTVGGSTGLKVDSGSQASYLDCNWPTSGVATQTTGSGTINDLNAAAATSVPNFVPLVLGNSIWNSNFNDGTTGWEIVNAATMTLAGTPPITNGKCLEVTTSTQYGSVGPVSSFNCNPGDPIFLSCWIKSDGTFQAYAQATTFDGAGNALSYNSVGSTTSTSWGLYTGSFIADANAAYIEVNLARGDAGGGSHSAYFAEVVLSKGAPGAGSPNVLYRGMEHAATGNVTSLTSVLATPTVSNGSLTLPANTQYVGSTIHIKAAGTITVATAAMTITFAPYLNGEELSPITATSVPTTSNYWEVEFWIYCSAVGAASTAAMYSYGQGAIDNTSTTLFALHGAAANTTTTVATTSAQAIDLKMSFGTTESGNTCACQYCEVEIY